MIYLLDVVQVRPAIAGLASSAQKVDKLNMSYYNLPKGARQT